MYMLKEMFMSSNMCIPSHKHCQRRKNLSGYLRVALASAARNMNLDSSLSIRASRPPYSCSCIASAMVPLLEPSPGATDLSRGLRGLQSRNLQCQSPKVFQHVNHQHFTLHKLDIPKRRCIDNDFARPKGQSNKRDCNTSTTC